MIPYVQDTDFTLYVGDVRQVLAELPAESVDCVVTSPPYWGLRDYGVPGQIGLEASPEAFIAEMVAVFRQVRRVLASHGTCWINLGDSYAGSVLTRPFKLNTGADAQAHLTPPSSRDVPLGLKPKDLVGIPWRTAFALQADGWWLRADIIEEVEFYCPCGCGHIMEERVWRYGQDRDLIWKKPNPMPESVTDRPTKSHEYVFLLSKQPRYFFDQEAVREPAEWAHWGAQTNPKIESAEKRQTEGVNGKWIQHASRDEMREKYSAGRNIRSVWEIATQPYPDAHFATFPEALPERCIKAGCPEFVCVTCGEPRVRIVETTYVPHGANAKSGGDYAGDRTSGDLTHGKFRPQEMKHGRATRVDTTSGWSDCGHGNYRTGVVLDPFIGSGTTALVARRHGRHTIGIELNPKYAELCARRLSQLSLLAEETAG